MPSSQKKGSDRSNKETNRTKTKKEQKKSSGAGSAAEKKTSVSGKKQDKSRESNDVFQCGHCEKQFKTIYLLESHVVTNKHFSQKLKPLPGDKSEEADAKKADAKNAKTTDTKNTNVKKTDAKKAETEKGDAKNADGKKTKKKDEVSPVKKPRLSSASPPFVQPHPSKTRADPFPTTEEEDEFCCGLCSRAFKECNDLENHLRYCSGPKSKPDTVIQMSDFLCGICQASFPSGEQLEQHMLQQHVKSESQTISAPKQSFTTSIVKSEFMCGICKCGFDDSESLERHVLNNCGKTSMSVPTPVKRKIVGEFACGICGTVFGTPDQLVYHIETKKGACANSKTKRTVEPEKRTVEPQFICGQCNKSFLNSSLLEQHMISQICTKVSEEFVCGLCNETFSSAELLEKHMISEQGNCIASPKIIKSKLKSKAEEFRCGPCKISFMSTKSLEKHLADEHGIGTDSKSDDFVCGFCKEVCQSSDQLEIHIASGGCTWRPPVAKKSNTPAKTVSQKEENFECSVCKLAFTKKELLTRHRCSGTAPKPFAEFKCIICGDKFNSSAALKEHMSGHEQDAREKGNKKKEVQGKISDNSDGKGTKRKISESPEVSVNKKTKIDVSGDKKGEKRKVSGEVKVKSKGQDGKGKADGLRKDAEHVKKVTDKNGGAYGSGKNTDSGRTLRKSPDKKIFDKQTSPDDWKEKYGEEKTPKEKRYNKQSGPKSNKKGAEPKSSEREHHGKGKGDSSKNKEKRSGQSSRSRSATRKKTGAGRKHSMSSKKKKDSSSDDERLSVPSESSVDETESGIEMAPEDDETSDSEDDDENQQQKSFACKYCGKTYPRKRPLISHQNNHIKYNKIFFDNDSNKKDKKMSDSKSLEPKELRYNRDKDRADKNKSEKQVEFKKKESPGQKIRETDSRVEPKQFAGDKGKSEKCTNLKENDSFKQTIHVEDKNSRVDYKRPVGDKDKSEKCTKLKENDLTKQVREENKTRRDSKRSTENRINLGHNKSTAVTKSIVNSKPSTSKDTQPARSKTSKCKKYSCVVCSKEFDSKNSLDIHVLSHFNEENTLEGELDSSSSEQESPVSKPQSKKRHIHPKASVEASKRTKGSSVSKQFPSVHDSFDKVRKSISSEASLKFSHGGRKSSRLLQDVNEQHAQDKDTGDEGKSQKEIKVRNKNSSRQEVEEVGAKYDSKRSNEDKSAQSVGVVHKGSVSADSEIIEESCSSSESDEDGDYEEESEAGSDEVIEDFDAGETVTAQECAEVESAEESKETVAVEESDQNLQDMINSVGDRELLRTTKVSTIGIISRSGRRTPADLAGIVDGFEIEIDTDSVEEPGQTLQNVVCSAIEREFKEPQKVATSDTSRVSGRRIPADIAGGVHGVESDESLEDSQSSPSSEDGQLEEISLIDHVEIGNKVISDIQVKQEIRVKQEKDGDSILHRQVLLEETKFGEFGIEKVKQGSTKQQVDRTIKYEPMSDDDETKFGVQKQVRVAGTDYVDKTDTRYSYLQVRSDANSKSESEVKSRNVPADIGVDRPRNVDQNLNKSSSAPTGGADSSEVLPVAAPQRSVNKQNTDVLSSTVVGKKAEGAGLDGQVEKLQSTADVGNILQSKGSANQDAIGKGTKNTLASFLGAYIANQIYARKTKTSKSSDKEKSLTKDKEVPTIGPSSSTTKAHFEQCNTADNTEPGPPFKGLIPMDEKRFDADVMSASRKGFPVGATREPYQSHYDLTNDMISKLKEPRAHCSYSSDGLRQIIKCVVCGKSYQSTADVEACEIRHLLEAFNNTQDFQGWMFCPVCCKCFETTDSLMKHFTQSCCTEKYCFSCKAAVPSCKLLLMHFMQSRRCSKAGVYKPFNTVNNKRCSPQSSDEGPLYQRSSRAHTSADIEIPNSSGDNVNVNPSVNVPETKEWKNW